MWLEDRALGLNVENKYNFNNIGGTYGNSSAQYDVSPDSQKGTYFFHLCRVMVWQLSWRWDSPSTLKLTDSPDTTVAKCPQKRPRLNLKEHFLPLAPTDISGRQEIVYYNKKGSRLPGQFSSCYTVTIHWRLVFCWHTFYEVITKFIKVQTPSTWSQF